MIREGGANVVYDVNTIYEVSVVTKVHIVCEVNIATKVHIVCEVNIATKVHIATKVSIVRKIFSSPIQSCLLPRLFLFNVTYNISCHMGCVCCTYI